MKRLLSHLLVYLFLTGLWLLPISAKAQEEKREQLAAAGKVTAIPSPGILQLTTSGGDKWLVRVEAKPQDVVFTGTAEKWFLRTGMFVRFSAPVNKRGTVLEPVSSLVVFTPSEANPPGLLPEGDSEGPGEGLFGGESKDEKKEKKKPAKAKVEDAKYRIAGQLTKIGRGGDITVNTGNAAISAKLAEECKISVEVNDLSFLLPGDNVELKGWYLKSENGGAHATQVDASAANPLTDGSKKKPRATKAGEKGAKSDKPADETKNEEPKGDAKKDTDKSDQG